MVILNGCPKQLHHPLHTLPLVRKWLASIGIPIRFPEWLGLPGLSQQALVNIVGITQQDTDCFFHLIRFIRLDNGCNRCTIKGLLDLLNMLINLFWIRDINNLASKSQACCALLLGGRINLLKPGQLFRRLH